MILDHDEFEVWYKFVRTMYTIALDDSDYFQKDLGKGLFDLSLRKHGDMLYKNGEWK